MLSGTFTGIGSIILFAHLGGSAPVDFNMNNVVRPLVAIILGGTPLVGGTGGPHRTILGVFTFSILYRGLYLSALRPEVIDLVVGHRAHPVRHHQLHGCADEGGGCHMSEPCASPTPARLRKRLKTTTIMPIVATVVVIGIFQILNPTFLSYQGIVTIVYAMSYFLIAACGLTLVIMMGSFDFSVVAVMKLSALLCVLFIEKIGLLVIPLALAVSAAIGFINGVLFAKLKVPSFIATLGISVVLDGISLLSSRGFLHLLEDERFRSISVTFIAGLPSIFYWALAVWLLCTVLSVATPFGRRVFAIGGNPRAAALSGVNVDRHRITVFVLSSFLAGLAGVLYVSQQGGWSMEIGGQMMIPLFASVVAGGTSLRGGVGGPQRTLLGVIIITWIQSGLLMMGLGREIQFVILGVIAIIMAVATTERGKLTRLIVK